MRRRDLILCAAAVATVRPALSQDAYVSGGRVVVPEPEVDGPLRMRDLYEKDGDFSPLAQSLEGSRIAVQGFMAPPLDPTVDFFVLTKRPMAVCPFCEAGAEWPPDILAVYTKRPLEPVSFNRRIEVTGVLEMGGHADHYLGFVSRVRLQDAVYQSAV